MCNIEFALYPIYPLLCISFIMVKAILNTIVRGPEWSVSRIDCTYILQVHNITFIHKWHATLIPHTQPNNVPSSKL